MPSDLRAVDIDFLATAPFRFVFTSQIARPPERVFEAIAERPESWGDWYPGFDHSGHWTSDQHGGVGSRRTVRMARVTYEETILEWDPPHRFSFRVDRAAPPLANAFGEVYAVTPHEAGSVVQWTLAIDPKAPIRPFLRFGQPVLDTLFGRAMANLERRL